jgi:hypothetical protein
LRFKSILTKPGAMIAPESGASAAQHQQLVDAAEQRRPVGDDEQRHALFLQAAHRVEKRLLALLVEVGVRLVQDHQLRVAVERARERDALALARRERLARLAHFRVVAFGQPQHHLVDLRALRGADHGRRIRLAEPGDVFRHRAAEELDVLGQIADMRPEHFARPGRDVRAVETHRAGDRPPHADDEPRERRLARRAGADDAERFARADVEGHAAQDRALGAFHRENRLLELDTAGRRRKLRRRARRGIGGEKPAEPQPGRARLDQVLPSRHHHFHWRKRAACCPCTWACSRGLRSSRSLKNASSTISTAPPSAMQPSSGWKTKMMRRKIGSQGASNTASTPLPTRNPRSVATSRNEAR